MRVTVIVDGIRVSDIGNMSAREANLHVTEWSETLSEQFETGILVQSSRVQIKVVREH